MKELRYILAILFSSLIIISGVGVSVVHYCCAGCETMQRCCSSGCPQCANSYHSLQKLCQDTGCTAVHYKVDLVKYAPEASFITPLVMLLCEQLPQLSCSLLLERHLEETYKSAPPLSVGSRHYLALYSILLI